VGRGGGEGVTNKIEILMRWKIERTTNGDGKRVGAVGRVLGPEFAGLLYDSTTTMSVVILHGIGVDLAINGKCKCVVNELVCTHVGETVDMANAGIIGWRGGVRVLGGVPKSHYGIAGVPVAKK